MRNRGPLTRTTGLTALAVLIAAALAMALVVVGGSRSSKAGGSIKRDVRSTVDAVQVCAASQPGGGFINCDSTELIRRAPSLSDAMDRSAAAGSATGTGVGGGVDSAAALAAMRCTPKAGAVCMQPLGDEGFAVVGREATGRTHYLYLHLGGVTLRQCGTLLGAPRPGPNPTHDEMVSPRGAHFTKANGECPTGTW